MKMKSLLTFAVTLVALGATGSAQSPPPAKSPRSGSDPQFKVRLDFNRWHDTDEL